MQLALEHERMANANAAPNADRIVVLDANSSVGEAVRALGGTYVGAILVEEHGKLAGIVTLRDLALRMLGLGLDPDRAVLAEVMTTDPVVLPLGASEQEVLRTMRDRRVRRVPLVDGERIAGVVALDDLILSPTAEPELVREAVRAQLAAPLLLAQSSEARVLSAALPAGASADGTERRAGRAGQALHDFESHARDLLGLVSTEQARVAIEVVVGSLVQRLGPSEAHLLVARLPAVMKDKLLDLGAGPERHATPTTIAAELAQELGIDARRAPELLLRICGALDVLLGSDAMARVARAMPADLRGLFRSETARVAAKS